MATQLTLCLKPMVSLHKHTMQVFRLWSEEYLERAHADSGSTFKVQTLLLWTKDCVITSQLTESQVCKGNFSQDSDLWGLLGPLQSSLMMSHYVKNCDPVVLTTNHTPLCVPANKPLFYQISLSSHPATQLNIVLCVCVYYCQRLWWNAAWTACNKMNCAKLLSWGKWSRGRGGGVHCSCEQRINWTFFYLAALKSGIIWKKIAAFLRNIPFCPI